MFMYMYTHAYMLLWYQQCAFFCILINAYKYAHCMLLLWSIPQKPQSVPSNCGRRF